MTLDLLAMSMILPSRNTSPDCSRCAAVTSSDVEDSSSDSSKLEGESNSEDETKDEEELIEVALATCDLCSQAPCDWVVFGEEVWDECNNLKEQDSNNKAVQYHAYKMYTYLRHGVLCHFDC